MNKIVTALLLSTVLVFSGAALAPHAFVREPVMVAALDRLLARHVPLTAYYKNDATAELYGFEAVQGYALASCTPLISATKVIDERQAQELNIVAIDLQYDWCLLTAEQDARLPLPPGFASSDDSLMILAGLYTEEEGGLAPFLVPTQVVHIDTTTAQAIYVVRSNIRIAHTGMLLSEDGELLGIVAPIELDQGLYMALPLISMHQPVPREAPNLDRALTLRDYARRVVLHSRTDDQREIASVCNEWKNNFADDPGAAHCLATVDVKAERFDAAAALLQPLIETSRTNWIIYRTAAELTLKYNNTDNAITFFQEALRGYPEDFTSTFALGTLLLQSERSQEAKETLTLAHQMRPESIPVLSNLVRTLLATGDYDEAQQLITQGIQNNPDNLALLYSQAELYCATDNAGEAMGLWKQIRLLNKDLAQKLYSECLAGELL